MKYLKISILVLSIVIIGKLYGLLIISSVYAVKSYVVEGRKHNLLNHSIEIKWPWYIINKHENSLEVSKVSNTYKDVIIFKQCITKEKLISLNKQYRKGQYKLTSMEQATNIFLEYELVGSGVKSQVIYNTEHCILIDFNNIDENDRVEIVDFVLAKENKGS